MRWLGSVLLLTACAAGSPIQNDEVCTVEVAEQNLDKAVRETSGLAVGRENHGILWTHNDSGADPELYAIDSSGALKGKVMVTGAELTDWEDIEAASCDGGHCIYIADIGDNAGRRSHVTIYELPEPVLPATEAGVRRAIIATYDDGPQDAEAIFRLPAGETYLVTKGRHRDIALYRLELADGQTAGVLRRVRSLAPHPVDEADRVTAASASPSGQWVAIRTYRTLWIYRSRDLLGQGTPVVTYPLTELKERQGEAISIDDEGNLISTSEAEQAGVLPTLARLSCTLP